MKSKRNIKAIVTAFAGLILLIVGVVVFNWFAANAEKEITSTKLSDIPDSVEIISTTGSIVGYEKDELMARSTLVAYGEVEKIYLAQNVVWVGGGSSIVTDISFKVYDVLRGEATENVTVRVNGGLHSNIYSDYPSEPELIKGEKYILFLYQPNRGGGQITKGDQYYITGLLNGAYRCVEDDGGEPVFKLAMFSNVSDIIFADSFLTAKDDWAFTLSDIKADFEGFNEQHPIDYDLFRKESEAAYKTNLENEIITEEEYEIYMRELDEYATFGVPEIDPSEQARIDAEKDVLRSALEKHEGLE